MGSFLVFRGAQLDSTVIKQWEKRIGTEKTKLPDILPRFNENLSTALDTCFENPQPSLKPTIFILSVRNWKGYSGFQQKNEAYSAYPGERQIIFF